MNLKHTILTAALLALAAGGAAQAQNSGGKTGDKSSEMSTPNQDKGSTSRSKASEETRADVKAETAAAKASGAMAKGQQSTPTQGSKPMKAQPSQTSRAEVKADAVAAKKSGDTPKGQESVKDQNKGGVTKP